MDEAAANRVADMIKLFEARPGFSSAQVWMRDRMNRLAQRAPVESRAFGSKARSRLVLSMYNIRAAAFFRLITNVETQNDFLALLDELPHVAWFEFTGIGTPNEIRDGSPSIDLGIARRKRWWIRRGYARLATLASHQSSGMQVEGKPAKAAGESPARDAVDLRDRKPPLLNASLIKAWMEEEGWINETLAERLGISERAVSSIRNNGSYHGLEAVTRLANLMGRDPEELYLPPEAST
jgi:hypothetical protein